VSRDPRGTPVRLAIVTPVFNEEGNLERYAEVVSRVLLDEPGVDARVLFVDDGSSDGSWKVIQEICARDERFRGIRLSRNFGAHTALSAGFHALGDDVDAAVVLACDLQDPPETVLAFLERWRDGADIVWGVRRRRKDAIWRSATSRMFQSALRRWAFPKDSQFSTGTFLLLDRPVLDAVRAMPERNRITFALVAWTGFDQAQVEYDRGERMAGRSGWTFAGMLRAMYDAFLGFSTVPIRLMTFAAALSFVAAGALIVYLLIVLIVGDPVPGWTSQMLVMSVFFAIQFSLMGVLGEYMYRIYSEATRRPLFFVSDTTDQPPASGSSI